MPRPYIATGVPLQSVLEITVTSTAPTRFFTSSGELERPTGPTRYFTDAELAKGAPVTLGTAGSYPGFIDIVFAKSAKGTVTIDLVDAQGNPVRPPFVEPVAGGAGKIQTIYLFLGV